MRCAVLHGPRDLKLEQKETPAATGNRVLVKVAACGVCGTDVLLYSGRIARPYPYNPGHECVGIVAAVGDQVTHVGVGDRVAVDPNHGCGTCPFCVREAPHLCENLNAPGVKSNGGFAEYCAVPAKLVHRLPDSLSLEAGVLAEPLSCALHTIELAGVNLEKVASG